MQFLKPSSSLKLGLDLGLSTPKSKYGNKPVTIDGERYRSEREAQRHRELLALQRAGRVENLRREVPFVLAPSARIAGRTRPALRYFADFTYTQAGAEVVEDVKGVRTAVYVLKRHLMKTVHGIEIRET